MKRLFGLSLLLVLAGTATAAAPTSVPAGKVSERGIEVATLSERGNGLSPPLVAMIEPAANAEVRLAFALPGFVRSVQVFPGDRVEVGQALFSVFSAEAMVLQRDYLTAIGELDRESRFKARDDALYKAGVIARNRWLDTVNRWHNAKARVESTGERLRALGVGKAAVAKLRDSRELISAIEVTAPMAGVVLDTNLQRGGAVDAGAMLVHIADPKRLRVHLSLPAGLVGTVAAGDRVEVDRRECCVVSHVAAAVEPGRQAVTVYADVDGDGAGLLAGQIHSARVHFARREGLLIPAAATTEIDGRQVVFVADGERFVVRPVTTAPAGERLVVLDGLSAGERIAVAGVPVLKGALLGMGGDE